MKAGSLIVFSSSFNLLIEFEIVFQFVKVPPSHRLFTKKLLLDSANSLTDSAHCFFVPTNKIFPDLETVSCILTKELFNASSVILKSNICILFLTPKI